MAPNHRVASQRDDDLCGVSVVFRSLDRGTTWQTISADLSDNDPARMLRRSSSEIPYQTVIALAESPKKPGLLYAGTDDGRLHVTMDDGKRWSEITAALRGRKWISRVVPSQHAEGTVYVTQRGREEDDFAPYIYKSIDYGGTFTSIVNNIPAGSVNVVREDPADPGTLTWARTSVRSCRPTVGVAGRFSEAICPQCRSRIFNTSRGIR